MSGYHGKITMHTKRQNKQTDKTKQTKTNTKMPKTKIEDTRQVSELDVAGMLDYQTRNFKQL